MECERLYRGFMGQLEEVNFWLHKADEVLARSDQLPQDRQESQQEQEKIKVNQQVARACRYTQAYKRGMAASVNFLRTINYLKIIIMNESRLKSSKFLHVAHTFPSTFNTISFLKPTFILCFFKIIFQNYKYQDISRKKLNQGRQQ